jgi:tripartite-type tricarboxylate transporter receptor subunit TctC
MRGLVRVFALAGVFLVLISARAPGADYPNAPVRIIFPGTAGSTGDVGMRKLAETLSMRLNARFVVENKPGASGAIASSYVARSKPDGYTLLAVFINFVTAPALMEDAGYDPVRDFVPVGSVSVASPILVVNPSLPAHNLKELIDLAKAKPGSVSIANGGSGGSNHLPAVLFERAADIELLHVPYKGEGQAVVDVVGGRVAGSFMYVFTALPQIRDARLRPLAVTMRKRNPSLPDVPTMEEAGLPGFEFESWIGLVAPAGTPRPIVDLLNREISAAMHTPDTEARVAAAGSQIYTQSPDEFAAVIKRDVERYGKLIRELEISMD